jgi:hypothetical protein
MDRKRGISFTRSVCINCCVIRPFILRVVRLVFFAEREAGSEAQMGVAATGQTAQGHRPGMSRGICSVYHRTKGQRLRPVQS